MAWRPSRFRHRPDLLSWTQARSTPTGGPTAVAGTPENQAGREAASPLREIHDKWRRLLAVGRRHGLRGALLFLARRVWFSSPRGESCRLFLYALDDPRPVGPETHDPGHEFRFATEGDVERLCRDPATDVEPRDVAAYRAGCRCLLQQDGNRLVGYTWIASARLVELMWGLHYNLPDDTVYNYRDFTLPEYRGRGFQPLRNRKILELVRTQDGRRLFAYIDHLNFNSLRGVAKSGYRRVGTVRLIKRRNHVRVKLTVSRDFWTDQRRTAGP